MNSYRNPDKKFICNNCHKEFRKKRNNQDYCTKKCREECNNRKRCSTSSFITQRKIEEAILEKDRNNLYKTEDLINMIAVGLGVYPDEKFKSKFYKAHKKLEFQYKSYFGNSNIEMGSKKLNQGGKNNGKQ